MEQILNKLSEIGASEIPVYLISNDKPARVNIGCPLKESQIKDVIGPGGKMINKIIEENQGGRIIIVTHKDIIKAAIVTALKMPHSSLHRIYIK